MEERNSCNLGDARKSKEVPRRDDADPSEEREAGELGGMPEQGEAPVGGAVRVGGVRDGVGGVCAEQLEVR